MSIPHELLPVGASKIAPVRELRLPHLPSVSLPLYRIGLGDDAPFGPVLLLHGGSAWSLSFTTPRGRGLADALASEGFDVFLLDWRASRNISARFGSNADVYARTTLDDAAAHDLPFAVRAIEDLRANRRSLAIVGHCFGAGMTSMSVASGALRGHVDRVVLLTLGLFYDVLWDGLLKGEDHLLERVREEGGGEGAPHAVDSNPKCGFPKVVDEAFSLWPESALPQDAPEQFRRLAFMFGVPYLPENIGSELHSDAGLEAQFGQMHLRLYQHGVQNVRRGFAAPFDASESVSDEREALRRTEAPSESRACPSMHALLSLEPWKELRRVALITGEQNALWHRSSIDSMHEFLLRGLDKKACTKTVLPGYAHQDLLWGERAPRDVFPHILEALRSR